MGARDQLRGANGDGIVDRARSNPWLVVAIAAGAILLLAWIGWAVYVTSSSGASAGLGVVIAWPAMLLALAVISLPFIGGYMLIRRLSVDSGSPAVGDEGESETEGESDDTEVSDEGPEGEGEGPEGEDEGPEGEDEGPEGEDEGPEGEGEGPECEDESGDEEEGSEAEDEDEDPADDEGEGAGAEEDEPEPEASKAG